MTDSRGGDGDSVGGARSKAGFWGSIPGLVSGATALIVAATGAGTLLHQLGYLGGQPATASASPERGKQELASQSPEPARQQVVTTRYIEVGSKTSFAPQAAAEFAPGGTCVDGYVWREARPTDHVCVTAGSRALVAKENAVADERIDPAGPYGEQTCVSGYVWREAFVGDTVCVVPGRRDAVHTENAQAVDHTN